MLRECKTYMESHERNNRKNYSSHLPQKNTVKKKKLFDNAKIADKFNKIFSNIGTELQSWT